MPFGSISMSRRSGMSQLEEESGRRLRNKELIECMQLAGLNWQQLDQTLQNQRKAYAKDGRSPRPEPSDWKQSNDVREPVIELSRDHETQQMKEAAPALKLFLLKLKTRLGTEKLQEVFSVLKSPSPILLYLSGVLPNREDGPSDAYTMFLEHLRDEQVDVASLFSLLDSPHGIILDSVELFGGFFRFYLTRWIAKNREQLVNEHKCRANANIGPFPGILFSPKATSQPSQPAKHFMPIHAKFTPSRQASVANYSNRESNVTSFARGF